MKVIGKVNSNVYLCEVTHTELEKLTDKYYGKLSELRVGEELNLGAGYDFRKDIREACDRMTDAHKAFSQSSNTMRKFALMVAKQADSDDEK